MKYLPLVWHSMWRRKVRTTFTLLSIFIAFLLFGVVMTVRNAFSLGVEVAGIDRLVLINKVTLILPLPISYKQRIEKTPGVGEVTHQTWFNGAYQQPTNVLNSMAAIAVAMELEVKPEAIREGLATFSGVDRRFQMRGKEQGITVVDDYGHHPTEIRATLDGARVCGFRKIHVLFQPHRYSRTYHLMDEFARSFMQADSVFVMDIYAASEKPIEGVTAESLADRIRQFGHRGVEYVGTLDRGVDALVNAAGEGDLVLTLGAGNVWQAGDKVLQRLSAGGPA